MLNDKPPSREAIIRSMSSPRPLDARRTLRLAFSDEYRQLTFAGGSLVALACVLVFAGYGDRSALWALVPVVFVQAWALSGRQMGTALGITGVLMVFLVCVVAPILGLLWAIVFFLTT